MITEILAQAEAVVPAATDLKPIALAAAALGAAIGIGLLGSKAAEATGRNPGAAGPILTLSIILAALAEGVFVLTLLLG